MKILITGARSYVTYSMMKLAKLQKIEVIVGDSQKKSICFKSNLFYEKIIFPSPRYDFDNFKDFIIDYCSKKNISLIYPTCEEVFYFSIIKNDLERLGIKVFCDDISKLKLLHSKYDFINLIKGLEINIPETHLITSIDELSKYKESNKKSIFKYEYSRFANNIFVNFRDNNFKNINKLGKLDGNLVVQKFIKGKKICSFGIAKNGVLISNMCYESKLNYKGGSSTYFQNVFNEIINNFVQSLIKKLNFNGFISFDYICSEKGIYVIECNPRITSGIHLFDEKNELSDVIFNNEERGCFFPKEKVVKTFLIPNIFFNFLGILKNKEAFRYKNDVLKGEFKLFLYQIFLLFYYFYISLETQKTITEISTGDIEFNP